LFTFGTDGYRAIIGDGFDFRTVGELTSALCKSLKEKKKEPHVVIGYDTRFLSNKFAEYAAVVAENAGLKTELSDSFIPTPLLSHAVTKKNADAGIVITASHNPYYYNGFKIKNEQGGSASPEQIAALEPFLEKEQALPPHEFHKKPGCSVFNPFDDYLAHVEKIINKDVFNGSSLTTVVDPVYGAGKGYFKDLLEHYGLKVKEIHNDVNPAFGGLHPEPIGDNLNDLKNKVLEEKADVGLALDGDADRSGVIDEKGNFVNSHQIFALLLFHLVENKGLKGDVVKTFSTTSLVDIMAEKYGLEIMQTPIGFKHISNLMITNNVLIGGEESGGIGIKGHLPERDGLFIGLMLTELMVQSGKTINELINDLYSRFGRFSYDRIDKIVSPSAKNRLYKDLDRRDISKMLNKNLKQLHNSDGYKYEFEDRSWLMFRLSGTESIVRIYAEADNPEEVERLLSTGAELLSDIT